MATVVAWRGDRAAQMRVVIEEIVSLLKNGMTWWAAGWYNAIAMSP